MTRAVRAIVRVVHAVLVQTTCHDGKPSADIFFSLLVFALARRRRPPSKRRTEMRKNWRETIVRAVQVITRAVRLIVR